MNEEKWVLAQLKRWLVSSIEEDKAVKGYIRDIDKELVLAKIAEFEADAVLGEPEEQELPWAHLDDEKEDDR